MEARRIAARGWEQAQRDLWTKWRASDPTASDSELWTRYKHEWIEAYRPFVRLRENLPRWLLFA
jgi:hypothetical protein